MVVGEIKNYWNTLIPRNYLYAMEKREQHVTSHVKVFYRQYQFLIFTS